MLNKEELLREKLIKYVKTFARVNNIKGMEKSAEETINKITLKELENFASSVIKTQEKMKTSGGRRKKRRTYKRKNKKSRKNKTRKIQKGGNLLDTIIQNPFLAGIGFMVVAYYYPNEVAGVIIGTYIVNRGARSAGLPVPDPFGPGQFA